MLQIHVSSAGSHLACIVDAATVRVFSGPDFLTLPIYRFSQVMSC
jgi:hypothetical protein